MVAVRIDSGPIVATDLLRDVPRDKWHDLMLARRQYLEIRLNSDCRCLVEFVNDAKLMFGPLGFASPEAMIKEGYRLEPEEIGIAVEWLRLNPPNEPISLDATIKLAKHGGARTKGEKQGADGTLKRGSHSRAYILARLDRDGHAELAAEVRAGTMSANAAAIQAGFRKSELRTKRDDQETNRWLSVAFCAAVVAGQEDERARRVFYRQLLEKFADVPDHMPPFDDVERLRVYAVKLLLRVLADDTGKLRQISNMATDAVIRDIFGAPLDPPPAA